MAESFSRSEIKRFAKAAGIPNPARVVGGVRRVYLNPERVKVVEAKTINRSR